MVAPAQKSGGSAILSPLIISPSRSFRMRRRKLHRTLEIRDALASDPRGPMEGGSPSYREDTPQPRSQQPRRPE